MNASEKNDQPGGPNKSKVDLSEYGWREGPKAQVGSGWFADPHSVRVGIAELRQIKALRVDAQTWRNMDEADKIKALQAVEDRMAKVQGRPAERVYGELMEQNDYGGFDDRRRRRGIYVNTHSSKLDNLPEAVNTVVHEGRHAYQYHAIHTPEFHPEKDDMPRHEEVRDWSKNQGRNYKSIEKDGEVAYMTQVVEHDAGAYGFAVTKGLYPDYVPSQNRIDKYNAENAQSTYGYLKTKPDSQQVTSSDPARIDTRESTMTRKRKAAEKAQAKAERKVTLPNGQERTVKRQAVDGGNRKEKVEAKEAKKAKSKSVKQKPKSKKRKVAPSPSPSKQKKKSGSVKSTKKTNKKKKTKRPKI